MIKRRWIFIGDGSRAKIIEKSTHELRNVGLTHHSSELSIHKDKGHHKPGTFSPSIVHAKHSFPPHEEWGVFEKHEFAREMARFINEHVNGFEELLLIAPSKTLGDLRVFLHKQSLQKVVGEIAKDHTHTPIEKLKSIL
jgi:protein required for attachment to host cells